MTPAVEVREAAVPEAVAFVEAFNAKADRQRVPLSGSIELTRRCNLRCLHCYVGGSAAGGEPELDTRKMLSVIDEICEAGCLYLLLTGGEPLLREDFAEIYRHAKRSGLVVTVFTNATLVDEPTLEMFQEYPPYLVEVSLYGASAATYERITGVAGSYERCLRGVRGLLGRKIRVGLKTILMTENRAELHEIREIASGLGVKFRFDAEIFPRLDGGEAPLGLRVAPLDAIREEFGDGEKLRQWQRYFEKTKGAPLSDRLYLCSAGVSSFHVSAGGSLQPCLMVHGISHDLRDGSFSVGWRDVIPGISELMAGESAQCTRCEKRHLCGYCPGFFALESGSERVRSEYLCAIGDGRYRMVCDLARGEGSFRDDETGRLPIG